MSLADTISVLAQALDNEGNDHVEPSREILDLHGGEHGLPLETVNSRLKKIFSEGRPLSAAGEYPMIVHAEPEFAAELLLPIQDRAGRDSVVVCAGRIDADEDLDALPNVLGQRIADFCAAACLPSPEALSDQAESIAARLRADRTRSLENARNRRAVGLRSRLGGLFTMLARGDDRR